MEWRDSKQGKTVLSSRSTQSSVEFKNILWKSLLKLKRAVEDKRVHIRAWTRSALRMKKEKVCVDFQKFLETLDFGWARKYGKELDRQKEMEMMFSVRKKV